jgi:hypothetical protein
MAKTYEAPPPGYHYAFVAFITTKSGHRIYARSRGKRCFVILVKD